MPIPKNINREHIFQAIIKIEKEGIPNNQNLQKWALNYDGKNYPVKLIISWSNIFANKEVLDINPNNFQSQSAKSYLEKLGFNVVEVAPLSL